MIKINKINFQILNQNNNRGDSRLEFNINSININYVIMNTIRRIILSEIPIYAFTNFTIEKNFSALNNDMLKLRISNFPVWGIENNVNYINTNIINNQINNDNINDNNINNNDDNKNDDEDDEDDENDIDYNTNDTKNINKNIDISSFKQLTMYVNYKNKSKNIVSVNTDDIKFYYDRKILISPYKNNIPITKLVTNKEIIFTAITTINTESVDTCYSAVSIVTYKQINENNFNFILESRGQITEKRILIVAIVNIIRKINDFYKNIKDKLNNDLSGIIEMDNENNTLGNLILNGLQQHKNISFAGYNLPHPLIDKIMIKYSIKKDNIKIIIEDVVNYYIELFEKIKKEFETINNDTY